MPGPAAPLAQKVAARGPRRRGSRGRCTPPRSRWGRSRGFAPDSGDRSIRRPASRRKMRTSAGRPRRRAACSSRREAFGPSGGVEWVTKLGVFPEGGCLSSRIAYSIVWNDSCCTLPYSTESDRAFDFLFAEDAGGDATDSGGRDVPRGSRPEWSLEPCVHRQPEFPWSLQGLQPRVALRRDVRPRRRGPAALPETPPPRRLALGGGFSSHPR